MGARNGELPIVTILLQTLRSRKLPDSSVPPGPGGPEGCWGDPARSGDKLESNYGQLTPVRSAPEDWRPIVP